MKRRFSPSSTRLIFLLAVVVVLILSIITRKQWQKPPAEPARPAGTIQVVDGDTFVDAQGRKIRLLGIDAPEEAEPFSVAAKKELERQIAGRQLRLEFGAESTDRYGRLLAFVFADDSIFVNARLLEEGLARTYFFEENMKESPYLDRLCMSQRAAIVAKRGVWSLAPPRPETRYFANPHTWRFHRPDCSAVRGADTTEWLRTTNRDSLLEQCYSPCRNCKP